MLFGAVANLVIPGFGTVELKFIGVAYVAVFFAASRFANSKAQWAIALITLGLTVYYSLRYMAGI